MAETTGSTLCDCIDILFAETKIKVKPKQIEVVDNILKGQDTLCILPTGFGKSLIYQMLPAVYKKMVYSPCERPNVIVISPLVSLIANQTSSSNKLPKSLGIKATSMDLKYFSEISTGEFNLLYGTP